VSGIEDEARLTWSMVVILALVQGITEFLPISSSAHLILLPYLANWPEHSLEFDIAVHIGTLTAVVAYLRRDIINMLVSWWRQLRTGKGDEYTKLAWLVVWATLPIVIVGALFNDVVEQHLRAPAIIALATIGFALVLAWTDRRSFHQFPISHLNWKSSMVIGLAQCLALIPGTSRSGITISAALWLGFQREAAARYSFLLSIPVIAAAGIFELTEVLERESASQSLIWLSAAITAGISAFLCLHAFIRLVNRIGMLPFVYYRLVLGLFILALILI